MLPKIELKPRAQRDLADLLAFILRQPWGRPADRRRDIYTAFEAIREAPFDRPVVRWVGDIGMRRYRVRQFEVIYAYVGAPEQYPNGIVSVRAIKHRRVRNLLLGVREPGVSTTSPPLQIREAS
jgi:plasmid stabilization system protein ParE